MLKKARRKISLEEIAIDESRIKRGINGGIIIEIPGQEKEGEEKANRLAKKLMEVLEDEEVRISRPSINAEFRLIGIDNSVTKKEIKYTIADMVECHAEEVKTGEVKWMSNGLRLIS